LTPETLLFGLSSVDGRACPAASLGWEEPIASFKFRFTASVA
jgi:hypothetical protein